MLTEGEIRALIALHGEQTVSELATNLDRSPSYTSELVERLETAGLVETRRLGKTKQVRPSDAKALELLTDLTKEYSHIDWPELLSGATLRVCYYLDTPRTVTDLAGLADVHRSTVHRALDPFQHRGIVYQTDDGAYALNEGFEKLRAFAREFAHHVHRQTVEAQTDTYTILWESLDAFLVQTATEIIDEHFIPTGPDQFQRYDLPLLARDRRYYLYSETTSELSPELLCCHMLVIDSGPRSQSYCLLLLSHVDIDRDELRTQAVTCGVDDIVDELVTYANEALTDLPEQHNVTTPLHEPVAELTERVYEELEVLQAPEEPKLVGRPTTKARLVCNGRTGDCETAGRERRRRDYGWTGGTSLIDDLTARGRSLYPPNIDHHSRRLANPGNCPDCRQWHHSPGEAAHPGGPRVPRTATAPATME